MPTLNIDEYNIVGNDELTVAVCGDTWIQYERKKAHSYVSSTQKFHISVQHDKETIERGLSIVLPILAKYAIQCFKIINPEKIDSLRGSNADGKAITVYMQTHGDHSGEADPNHWIQLMNEIEESLHQRHIVPHPKGAQGDLLFPGSRGFIYFRNPHNIGSRYCSAHLLKERGFTRKEACNISDGFFLSGHSLCGDLAIEAAQEQGITFRLQLSKLLKHDVSTDTERIEIKEQEILQQLESQIYSRTWGFRPYWYDIFQLFLGDFRYYDEYLNDDSSRLLLEHVFGFAFGSSKIWKAVEGFYTRGDSISRLSNVFAPYLVQASKKIAKIQCLLERAGYDMPKLNSIFPAIYFYFYSPLHAQFKLIIGEHFKGDLPMIEKLRRVKHDLPALSQVEINRLIDEMILCSLRDPGKIAIDHEDPQYIHNLSQAEIKRLLSLGDENEANIDNKAISLSEIAGADAHPIIDQPKPIIASPTPPLYEQLSTDFKMFLSEYTKDFRQVLVNSEGKHPNTEEYWKTLDSTRQTELSDHYQSLLKNDYDRLPVDYQKFLTESTERIRRALADEQGLPLSIKTLWGQLNEQEKNSWSARYKDSRLGHIYIFLPPELKYWLSEHFQQFLSEGHQNAQYNELIRKGIIPSAEEYWNKLSHDEQVSLRRHAESEIDNSIQSKSICKTEVAESSSMPDGNGCDPILTAQLDQLERKITTMMEQMTLSSAEKKAVLDKIQKKLLGLIGEFRTQKVLSLPDFKREFRAILHQSDASLRVHTHFLKRLLQVFLDVFRTDKSIMSYSIFATRSANKIAEIDEVAKNIILVH